MLVFLYDLTTGQGLGNTLTPEQYDNVGKTYIEPPAYDTLTHEIYFVNGAWETREI